MSDKRILIIDSDYGFVSDLKDILEKNYSQVYFAMSFQKGIEIAIKVIPDLIICEVDLPDRDGLEFCKEVRSIGILRSGYFLLLSSRSDNFLQIHAYNTGVDEFMVKPVSERLLLSKVQSVFRRADQLIAGSPMAASSTSLRIDFERYVAVRSDKEIELPKKEFEILTLLYKSPKRVFSREEIKREIWGESDDVKYRTIDVHVKKLREKIGDDLIKTIKGVGYKFDQG